ncbi:MAG: hypothetical protein IJW30_06195 [Clostridia bacterium]|nr:hypothetical protein [Clostridia bacterium]
MQNRIPIRLVALLCALLCVLPLLTACSRTGDPIAATSFVSLELDEKERLRATVTLHDGIVQLHKGERAHLYELLPGEEPTAATLSKKEPVASSRIRSEMTFKFDLYDGIHSRLYSTFVVTDENRKLLLSTPRAIDTPEAIAKETAIPLWLDNPKGLQVTDVDSAAALGCAHAVIPVSVGTLAAPMDESDIYQYSYDGDAYELSASVLESLDRRVLRAYNSGMQVALRLVFTKEQAATVSMQAAWLDFLCERYDSAYMGAVSTLLLDAQDFSVKETVRLSSLAHKALRSNTPSGRIYILRDGTDLNVLGDFFSELGTSLAADSDMPWGVAVSPDTSARAWERTDTEVLTPNTLQAFRQTLAEQKNAPNHFAVCDLSFSATDLELQAASYAYAYAKAAACNADLILYKTQKDNATGLLSSSGVTRPITEIFANVDAGLDDAQLRLCRAIDPVIEEVARTLPTDCRVLAGIGSASAGSGKESDLFDFTTGECYDFSAVGGADAAGENNPSSYQSSSYDDAALYTWLHLDSPETGVRRIFATGEELEDVTALSFHLLAQYKHAGANDAHMTLRLQGTDKNGHAIRFEAESTVPAKSWQNVTFNVSAFTSAANLDEPVVMTLLCDADGEAESEEQKIYGLWIRSVSILRPKADMLLFWVLLLSIGGTAVSFFAIFAVWRAKNRRKRARRRRPASPAKH